MKKILRKMLSKVFRLKISIYKNILSDCRNISGEPYIIQPALFLGKGEVNIGGNVYLGYFPSPYFYSGYSHIEARFDDAIIKIGENTIISNNFVAIAEHRSIEIGKNCLVGTNVEILNSDFHHTESDKRQETNAPCKDIKIGNNVWLGNNVKILKGVSIGDNSVIAAGSIVVKDIPANSVAGGIPAKIIGEI